MKKFLISLIVLCAVLACANIGLAQESTLVTAVIDGKTSDRVHLRKDATTESKSLGLYFTGTEVLCDPGAHGEWVWVNVGQEAGYVYSKYLHYASDSGSVKSQQPSGTVKLTKKDSWVNLRLGPSQDDSVVLKLYQGDPVTILGETASHWYYVKSGSKCGYVMTKYVTLGASATPAPVHSAAMAAYRSVLLDQASFLQATDGRTLNIAQLISSFDGGTMAIDRFAVVDLDRDGTPEVVLSETVNGNDYDYGYEVLYARDNVVYGYELSARAMMDLKTDGTFSYSSGAADNGFGTMQFTPTGYVTDPVTYIKSQYDAKNNMSVSYAVDHKPSTEKAFHSAYDKQAKKKGVTWYDCSYDNIKRVLSGGK